jgi:hypothetical protein
VLAFFQCTGYSCTVGLMRQTKPAASLGDPFCSSDCALFAQQPHMAGPYSVCRALQSGRTVVFLALFWLANAAAHVCNYLLNFG